MLADYYNLVMSFIQNCRSAFCTTLDLLKKVKMMFYLNLFLSPKLCYRTQGHGVHELCVQANVFIYINPH